VAGWEFLGPPGSIWLDAWLASEPDLTAWLEKMNRVSASRFAPVMVPNATVGGRPAIVIVDQPQTAPKRLAVFFGDGAHFYRLWCWIACYSENGRPVAALPDVRRVLDSIRFSPEPVPAEIPDDIWQQALRIEGRCQATIPAPTPAPPRPDVSRWPTYEDTEQRYRLHYPAGATIATDQSGQTTFTLTDNQTTYAVRVAKREALVSSDERVARPAVLLATISQNPGLFDMSEIREFTINGFPAALVAYGYSDPKQEPCSTQRAQAVRLIAGKQLYMLTFEVAGPDQCDATAIPWFDQMLHSFEPY